MEIVRVILVIGCIAWAGLEIFKTVKVFKERKKKKQEKASSEAVKDSEKSKTIKS